MRESVAAITDFNFPFLICNFKLVSRHLIHMNNIRPSNDPQWYVLYTMPRLERKIRDEISDLKYESYLPQRLVQRKWTDRIRKVMEPLFRNYVFVKSTPSQRLPLLKIPGIIKFVSFDRTPASIPEREIQRIRLVEERAANIDVEPYLSPGDKVVVTGGLFEGLEGELIRKVNRTRLLIRMPALRQAVSVEICESEVTIIERCDAPTREG